MTGKHYLMRILQKTSGFSRRSNGSSIDIVIVIVIVGHSTFPFGFVLTRARAHTHVSRISRSVKYQESSKTFADRCSPNNVRFLGNQLGQYLM